MKKLSILIPVFNEQSTIYAVLEKVCAVKLNHEISREIIVVNDLSTDDSLGEIRRFENDFPGEINVIEHEVNQGKGAGIRTSLQAVSGDYVIVQDADMELNPEEYNILIEPIIKNEATVVYGSRFLNSSPKGSRLSRWANGFLTWLSNFVFRTKLTDMETCYKLVPSAVFQAMILKEDRFGFEPEITAKLAKVSSIQFKEVPITYTPRNIESGKKIGWKDGVRAVYCILKYGWFTSRRKSFNTAFHS